VKFFKNMSLDVHANMLSQAFATIRSEYYSCIVENVMSATGAVLPANKMALAGDADLCLKKLQCIIATICIIEKRYVSGEREFEVFLEALVRHCGGKDRDAVYRYLLQHSKSTDIASLVAEASLPIAHYLYDYSADDFDATFATSRTLTAFPSATKYAIASEFGDKRMMHEMQLEAESFAFCVKNGI